ncbi:MAG: site-specific integrase [Acidiferrobacteraceae bacterium]
MASITYRGPRQWLVRVRRKGFPLQSKTLDTKAQAEAWVRQIEGEMDRGIFVSRAEAECTTLAEALERYIQEYLPQLKHPPREISRARWLQRQPLATMYLAAIRGKDIAAFRDALAADGRAANTIRLQLAMLSRLFNVACREWGMESLRNPVELVRKPKLPPGRDRRLQEGEEQRLLATLNDQGRTPWMAPLVRMALETAMRMGELLTLRWERVDLIRKTAYLPETKNGTPRTVPLSPTAIALLKAMPRDLSGRVFPLTQSAVEQAWQRATQRADIEGLRFHDLRHEATSRLFEKGFSLMEVAAITGHKTLQMLKRYTHLRAEDLAARL